MRKQLLGLLVALACLPPLVPSARANGDASCTVPVTLDHNRMLVDGEMQRKDGSWRKVRLWVDTGNPDFFISEALARDLGLELPAPREKSPDGRTPPIDVPPPGAVRLGGMSLSFEGVKSTVLAEPRWLFSTMHNDANLPATVLKKYQVVFDYPRRRLTIAEPGSLKHRGVRAAAAVHPTTGIVQIEAIIDGEGLSFALDNGASYSFASAELLAKVAQRHPSWPRVIGAVGCANIWGWWPQEEAWPIMRLPEVRWGGVVLPEVGLVGLPKFFPGGAGIGEWYSKKTAGPVEGILGPNAFKTFRVEVDYQEGAVYFEKSAGADTHDMDLVGLTLRPMPDGSYQVIGVAAGNGRPAAGGVEVGDTLLQVGELKATGATMGAVVDALRGKPGQVRTLLVKRKETQLTVKAPVERFL